MRNNKLTTVNSHFVSHEKLLRKKRNVILTIAQSLRIIISYTVFSFYFCFYDYYEAAVDKSEGVFVIIHKMSLFLSVHQS